MAKRAKRETLQEAAKEPHDAFFRQLLAQPATAAEFIENYLPAEVVAVLDLTKLQPEKDSFIDARLRKHMSDLLYSVPLKSGGRAYLYLLFEHKSQPDKQARLQLLRYMTRIWEQEWRKSRHLSPIVPILFYHGQPPWSISTEFADLVEPPEVLAQYTPHFHHLLTDLSSYSDEEVRGEVWLRANLLVLKHIFDPSLGAQLPQILGLLHTLAQQESGLEMLRTILVYIAEANQSVSESEFEQGVAAVASPKGASLMTTLAQKWEEQGRVKGRVEGRVEGLEEGLEKGLERGLEAQRQTLLRLLDWRFHPSDVQMTGYQQQITRVTDLQALTQLIDSLLAAQTLTEFDEHLAACLASGSNR